MFKMMIAGDDKRSIKVAEILKEHFPNQKISILSEMQQLSETHDIYLLPTPATLDGNSLNNSKFQYSLTDFLNMIPEKSLIISAGYSSDRTVNMTDRDDFAYKNAVPTAEGAIMLAANSTSKTLADSNILITGFGRVAKLLAHRLSPFNRNITVAVRKAGDLALIDALGLNCINIEGLAQNLGRFDIVFNTVPYKIFNSKTLSAAKKSSVFIELASAQSGFEISALKDADITYINAPGLPSKVAPDSAGKIMAETVITILKENNFN